MSNRKRMPHKKSKKVFSRTAKRVHPKNGMKTMVMRGGYRL